MYQAINKSLLSIATLLMRQGVDITQTHDDEAGISSPLLLLVAAAEVRSRHTLSVCGWLHPLLEAAYKMMLGAWVISCI